MSGTGEILYLRMFDSLKNEYYEETLIPSSLNFNKDIRSFAGSCDITYGNESRDDVNKIRSGDFAEFYFLKEDGSKHQVSVCFLEDFQDGTNEQSISVAFNGRELLGQLIDPPFAKTQHYKAMTLFQFAELATRGEYVGDYCKFKNIPPVIGIKNYKEQMKLSTSLDQSKGALLQQYADLAINLVYQNRLGQLVIFGGRDKRRPVGVLEKGINIDSITVSGRYSSVISEVITFFTSSQAELDKNKIQSPTFLNNDTRVRGLIKRPLYKTFNSGDLEQFSVSADKRIEDIAKSLIRKSNSDLLNVVVDVSVPYYLSNSGERIYYEIGQTWVIISDQKQFKTNKNPSGTDKISMVLAGFHIAQDDGVFEMQLFFVEEGVLV